MEKRISIIHPSRSRPKQAWETMFEWTLNADNGRNIEYIMVVDEDDSRLSEYKYWVTEVTEGIILHIGKYKSAIEAINKGAKLATGDLLIIASDDFRTPHNWDTLLLEAIGNKTDFCAKTSDGHQDWLITLPIMDRAFYNRFGYVYHPDFSHMHADLDLTCRAWMLGKYIKLPLEFKHNHYSIIGEKPDAINIKNNSTWGQGKALFNKRLANNFDLTGDLVPLPILPKY